MLKTLFLVPRYAKTIICPFFLLFFFSAQAQKNTDPNVPAFGNVTKADLEMKACEFDDKAEAMVLLDDGTIDFIYGRGMELTRRIRIKILNNNGLDQANIHLRYHSLAGDEDISGLEAQTYNLDAAGSVAVTKVDKKLIYEKKLNKKYSEKAFTFPDVKVGSIIEYKFKHENIGLINWYFQRSIPVRYSRFVMDFPQEIEVATIPYTSHEYKAENKNTSTRNVRSYSMSNIPALRDEPYIINEDYYRDRLETKIVAYPVNGVRSSRILNWLQVIRILMENEDFGVQIKKNIPRTDDLDAKLKTVSSLYDRMKTVFQYVKNNMEWNEYYGFWASDGVKDAWKNKKGTAGEINLILVNLLKDAGVKAHPILVSTHDNGIVNTTDAGTYGSPGFLQFDKVMAYVEIENRVYVLDATQKSAPVHLIPAEILMTQGLVIEKIETAEWGWKSLWDNDRLSKNIMQIQGTVDGGGSMNGEVHISSFDYARLPRQAMAKKGKDKFIEKYVSASNPGLTVNDVQFENMESDSLPLVQHIKFTRPLNAAGDYTYFSANILTGLEVNPFVADNRFSDVFFGYNQSYTINGNFILPEDFEFEELPKNIKMRMPDTSIVVSRLSQVSNNMLQTRITLDIKKPVFPATAYSELQEFYKQLFDLLNEQFVIRKKKKA